MTDIFQQQHQLNPKNTKTFFPNQNQIQILYTNQFLFINLIRLGAVIYVDLKSNAVTTLLSLSTLIVPKNLSNRPTTINQPQNSKKHKRNGEL